jgi:hypothetical protein
MRLPANATSGAGRGATTQHHLRSASHLAGITSGSTTIPNQWLREGARSQRKVLECRNLTAMSTDQDLVLNWLVVTQKGQSVTAVRKRS